MSASGKNVGGFIASAREDDARLKVTPEMVEAGVDTLSTWKVELAHGIWSRRRGFGNTWHLLYMSENQHKILPHYSRWKQVNLKLLRKWAKDADQLSARLKNFQKRIGAPIP